MRTGKNRPTQPSPIATAALSVTIACLLVASTCVLVLRSSTQAVAAPGSPGVAQGHIVAAPPIEREPRRLAPPPRVERRPAARRAVASRCGDAGARVVRFRVEVDPQLPTTRARFARDVRRVLCDERSWIASGRVRFVYDPQGATLIALRTAVNTQQRCLDLIGLSVNMRYSCASRATGEAVLNADRWFGGSPTWDGPISRYRQMLVNHEVGHLIGQGHRSCARGGGPAPVMMQQSKGTGGCRPNPWPLRHELRSVR